jgi:hypothetical protein
MAQRDDFVWAEKGFQFGRAASGQGSNARAGAHSENPGSIPCSRPIHGSHRAHGAGDGNVPADHSQPSCTWGFPSFVA